MIITMLCGGLVHTNVIDSESTISNMVLGTRMASPTVYMVIEMFNFGSS